MTDVFWAGLAAASVAAAGVGVAGVLAKSRQDARRRAALEPLRQARAQIAGERGELRVEMWLASRDYAALHDVVLIDILGATQIDHLVLTRDGIAVLETKTLAGALVGNAEAQYWTQRRPGSAGSVRILNPLRQNHRHTCAVLEQLRDLPVAVNGHVVMAGSANIATDLAQRVVRLEDLATVLPPPPDLDRLPRALAQAWQRLEADAWASPDRREQHARDIGRRRRSG